MKMTFESNSKAVIKGMEDLRKRAVKTDDLMKKIAGDMKTKVDFRFRQAKGPDGTPWEPLKESTISNRKGGSSKPLNDSGDLKLSIHSKYTSTEAIVGSDRPYAAYQNFPAKKGENGTEKVTETVKEHTRKTKSGRKVSVRSHSRERSFPVPWGDKPGRPFIGFSKNQIATYKKWINQHLKGGG